jgi:hypothetical protein
MYLFFSRHGNEVNGCLEGKGKVVFKDGHVYEGFFSAGVMEGSGRYTRSDGTVCEGQFQDGSLSGQGHYQWTDGSTYNGEVKNGIRNGNGTCHFKASKSSYSGTWLNGKRSGKGRMIYLGDSDAGSSPDQCCYDGEWKDGKRHGWGIMKYKSGNVYEGEWSSNQKEGQGTMYWKDSGQVYKGEWLNGKQHGEGEHAWCLNRVDNSQYPLYNRYHGNWKNGKRNGNGTFFYANGSYYSGEWQDNKKHGKGVLILPSGYRLHCVFQEDVIIASSTDPLKTTSGNYLPLRTKTPLSTLIGDVDITESEGSRTEKFNSAISKLLPTSSDAEFELKQVHCVVLRHISLLKKVYHFYIKLSDNPQGGNGALSMMMLWQMVKDCNLHLCGMSLLDVSHLVDEWDGCGLNHAATLLMREFLQFLVKFSWSIHKGLTYTRGDLSKWFSDLIHHHLSRDIVISGVVFSSRECRAAYHKHSSQLEALYSQLATKDKNGRRRLILRQLLLRLKECGVLEVLTCVAVVKCLVNNVPLACSSGDYNMDYQMCYLEFCEAIFNLSVMVIFKNQNKGISPTEPRLSVDQTEPRPLADQTEPQLIVDEGLSSLLRCLLHAQP